MWGLPALHLLFDLTPPTGHLLAATTTAIDSDGSESPIRNSDKRRPEPRGESCHEITSLLPTRRSASAELTADRLQLVRLGLPGRAGGPVGRQPQLPRKAPLNLPHCLQTLPWPLRRHWPWPMHRWPAQGPARPVLGEACCHQFQGPSLPPSSALGLPALALGQQTAISPCTPHRVIRWEGHQEAVSQVHGADGPLPSIEPRGPHFP